jgi:signal peptidase II
MDQENNVPGSERNGIGGLRWLGLSAIIIVLDQWTKHIATAALQLHDSISVLPGLNWTLAHNYGVAFSILNNGPGVQRWGLSIFALLVACGFTWYLTRVSKQDRYESIAFALVIGGAVGNVMDRLRLGYVVDFIDVYWRTHHWPAFNIADSAICVGAGLILIFGWRHPKPDAQAPA